MSHLSPSRTADKRLPTRLQTFLFSIVTRVDHRQVDGEVQIAWLGLMSTWLGRVVSDAHATQRSHAEGFVELAKLWVTVEAGRVETAKRLKHSAYELLPDPNATMRRQDLEQGDVGGKNAIRNRGDEASYLP